MTDSEAERDGLSDYESRAIQTLRKAGSMTRRDLAVALNVKERELRNYVMQEGISRKIIEKDGVYSLVNPRPNYREAASFTDGAKQWLPGMDKKKKHRRPAAKPGRREVGEGQVGYICIADEFKLTELAEFYEKEGYKTKLSFDVLHLQPSPTQLAQHPPSSNLAKGFELFIFDYGVIVWWGYDKRHYGIVENDFMLPTSRINRFFVNRYQATLIAANFPVWCEFSPDTRENTEERMEPDDLFTEQMQYDHFVIRNDSTDVKLCVSHALAQSGKIDYLEFKITELTESCKPLPHELKAKGSVTITERTLLQLRGEVLYYRLMIKSGSDLLDEPELFWQHPWLKPFYTATKECFGISERVDVLDKKLDAANEILGMIADQFHQRHGSRLEWIVIWLVMIEVVIGVLELILDVKPWTSAGGDQGSVVKGAAKLLTGA